VTRPKRVKELSADGHPRDFEYYCLSCQEYDTHDWSDVCRPMDIIPKQPLKGKLTLYGRAGTPPFVIKCNHCGSLVRGALEYCLICREDYIFANLVESLDGGFDIKPQDCPTCGSNWKFRHFDPTSTSLSLSELKKKLRKKPLEMRGSWFLLMSMLENPDLEKEVYRIPREHLKEHLQRLREESSSGQAEFFKEKAHAKDIVTKFLEEEALARKKKEELELAKKMADELRPLKDPQRVLDYMKYFAIFKHHHELIQKAIISKAKILVKEAAKEDAPSIGSDNSQLGIVQGLIEKLAFLTESKEYQKAARSNEEFMRKARLWKEYGIDWARIQESK